MSPLVKVIWIDAVSDAEWVEFKDVDLTPREIVTVGFMLANTRTHIIVAQSWDRVDESFSNFMSIPKGMVKKVSKL